ncbi:hypothetical protein GSI_09993 [Ganoderma sinense ZZ0214-1]|uniref:DUF7223 domain-containing protein n=1 Tax=Ganoderma sinense ZZ0214-1 TaxID=1077348 RepID=A0A2G8S292_9APHY|nr:hypothetical protein GSI_09993 [Ganoderma sinense ZZ0214-1]
MALPVFFLAALFPLAALAANNWTVPCHAGECQWDLKSNHATGTMLLSGSNSSISDLTTAGGWTILDCNATAADQEIRAVCHDSSKCDHLNLNGAENTVVRLPNDCSSEPFAVVTRIWNHTDQSIPAGRRSLWKRRGGLQRSVQGITLSTNFAAANASQHGNITVVVSGSSMPGVILSQAAPGCEAASQACNTSSVSLSSRSSATTKSGSISLPDIAFDTNLFNASISCPQSGDVPAFNGTIVVDLQSNVTASLNYAVTYKTILFIPDLSSLTLTAGFDADLRGTLSLDADLTGGLTTGEVSLYSVGLPVLDFGSIFKLGPTFTIFAAADAVLDTKLEMDVDLAYTISGGQLVFPPSSSASGGLFSPGTSNIKLSASPNVTGNASLVAHLKPTVDFGVSILGHTSGIYLDLDASAELDLALTGAATGSVSAGTNGTSAEATGTGASGCVDISTGLAVDAGADVDLIIFKAGDDVTLFSKKFELFSKCFGVGNERRDSDLDRDYYRPRRALPGPSLSSFEEGWRTRKRHEGHNLSEAAAGRRRVAQKRDDGGLTCPTVLLGALVSIVEAAVDAAT